MGDKVLDNNTPALVKFGISGACEVHRLIFEDRDQLLRRKDEITPDIANLTCCSHYGDEVSLALVDCPSLTLAFMIFLFFSSSV